MREIKFRAWIKSPYDIMVQSEDILNFGLDCGKIIYAESEEHDMDKGTFELMQYTGLKDKNGVEIYEGDIVKGKAYEFRSPQRIIGVVEYNYCEFKVAGLGKTKGIKAELNTVYEVIGNIYENSYLLKEERK